MLKNEIHSIIAYSLYFGVKSRCFEANVISANVRRITSHFCIQITTCKIGKIKDFQFVKILAQENRAKHFYPFCVVLLALVMKIIKEIDKPLASPEYLLQMVVW